MLTNRFRLGGSRRRQSRRRSSISGAPLRDQVFGDRWTTDVEVVLLRISLRELLALGKARAAVWRIRNPLPRATTRSHEEDNCCQGDLQPGARVGEGHVSQILALLLPLRGVGLRRLEHPCLRYQGRRPTRVPLEPWTARQNISASGSVVTSTGTRYSALGAGRGGCACGEGTREAGRRQPAGT